MRLLIICLGLLTVVCILLFAFGLVSPRLESAQLPSCGVGLISGLLYLLLAARQSRRDQEARARRHG